MRRKSPTELSHSFGRSPTAIACIALLLLVAVIATVGCGDDQPTRGCTPSAESGGLWLRVLDGQTGLPATCGATIQITEATYTDSLRAANCDQPDSTQPEWIPGADDRPGVYDLVVKKERYRDWTRSGVVVKKDPGFCHARAVRLEAHLEPVPSGDDPLNRVRFHGAQYFCSDPDCRVKGAIGESVTCFLEIAFDCPSGERFAFRIQAPSNCRDSLIAVGTVAASGHAWDMVSVLLPGATSFSLSGLTVDGLSVTWIQVAADSASFAGYGYIQLEREIAVVCADSVWIGGRFATYGDPEYEKWYESYCEPGYYFPEQTIWFACMNGKIEI